MKQIAEKTDELIAAGVPRERLRALADEYEYRALRLRAERDALPRWRMLKRAQLRESIRVYDWAIIHLTLGSVLARTGRADAGGEG